MAKSPRRPREIKRSADRDAAIGSALAFVAGFVDAAGFILVFGLFTAHVTANFVLVGAELVSASTDGLAKVLALPEFVLAVAATRLVGLKLERSDRPPVRWLLGLEALVLVGFCLGCSTLEPGDPPSALKALVVSALGVASMGVQNATGRMVLGHLSATAVMTVNVTQVVLDATDVLRGDHGKDGRTRARLRRMGPGVLAFAIGALAGAFGAAAVSYWCLLAPVATLLALMPLSGGAAIED